MHGDFVRRCRGYGCGPWRLCGPGLGCRRRRRLHRQGPDVPLVLDSHHRLRAALVIASTVMQEKDDSNSEGRKA